MLRLERSTHRATASKHSLLLLLLWGRVCVFVRAVAYRYEKLWDCFQHDRTSIYARTHIRYDNTCFHCLHTVNT